MGYKLGWDGWRGLLWAFGGGRLLAEEFGEDEQGHVFIFLGIVLGV